MATTPFSSPSQPSTSNSPRSQQRPRTRTPTRRQHASTSTSTGTSASEEIELTPLQYHTPRSQPETPVQRSAAQQEDESPFSDRNSIHYRVAVEQPGRVARGAARKLEYGADEMDGKRQDLVLESDKELAFLRAYDRFSALPGLEYHAAASAMDLGPPPSTSPPLTPAYPYPLKTMQDHPDLQPSPPSPSTPTFDTLIRPRFRLLFSLTSTRDCVIHILPATFLSIIASIIPPYMTVLVGDLFIPFSAYPADQHVATPAQSAQLNRDVSAIALKLALVGVVGFVVHTLVGRLWIGYGERVADRLRRAAYDSVVAKEMAWFDLGMGMKGNEQVDTATLGESVGAGGLMAKFTRETDDVRLGCSMAMGNVIQHTFTFILCLVLAMVRAPILALVTLAAIPLVIISHLVTQTLLTPLYTAERRAFAEASTHIERSTAAIATVKAFNAQSSEQNRFHSAVRNAEIALETQGKIWGVGEGLTMFFTSVMFVAGFWFGAKLVREGNKTVGDVMTVFWACLMACGSLQSIVPDLAVLSQAKNSMASQLTIIRSCGPSTPRPASTYNPFSPIPSPASARFSTVPAGSKSVGLKRIRPAKCRGEFVLRNITFAYPSRPDQLVLNDVSMFLPAGETTFVVGGSGSGKSTIAQLLLKLYVPLRGDLTMDDQEFKYLDEMFSREHVAAVQQGCILFDLSVHDNVALGVAGAGPNAQGVVRRPEDVTRDEVIAACKMAVIHDFIIGLPEGYDTLLGTGGSSLSGGQKQRLSIARARVRDPTVLILDEATSALDATSRVLVFEAVKQWRKNRTTIVITHDLSQILPDDFVYVMKDGCVVEQGFRSDLMAKQDGRGLPCVFASMAMEQSTMPLPMTEGTGWQSGVEVDQAEKPADEDPLHLLVRPQSRVLLPHTPSFQFGLRPASSMYLGILDDYARRSSVVVRDSVVPPRPNSRLSWVQPRPSSIFGGMSGRTSRASMVRDSPVPLASALRAPPVWSSHSGRQDEDEEILNDDEWDKSSRTSVSVATFSSPGVTNALRRRSETDSESLEIKIETPSTDMLEREIGPLGALGLIRAFFPGLPSKYLLVLGLIGSIGHGVLTPIWSSHIATLMSYVSSGGTDTGGLTRNGISLIGICIAQAAAIALHAACLDLVSNKWAAKARAKAYGSMILQEKSWFDQALNSPSRLMQVLIKDADDMRALMSHCIGHLIVATTMIGLGLTWAMVVGWRLTLVGLAISPVFVGLMVAEATALSKMETINKRRREDVARTFYESVSNVRPIRAMALEGVFQKTFEGQLRSAYASGLRAGWVKGVGTGASAALPFLAQSLLNWVSAIFMTRGYYDYTQVLQVYALVLFSITFGAQMLDFVPEYAKARIAASDFFRLYSLPTTTRESEGSLRFPISGNVVFEHVGFAYPTRADCQVLKDVCLNVPAGETVAIVGPSGSGKSTIAGLLQRLYEPSGGKIMLDRFTLDQADVRWLRDHIAVVSQHANLFDGTIAENIAYGSDVPLGEIQIAARAASVHAFIMSLPDGYETNLGENASLISGGQAQRLQIARALVRRSSILILDECTSALDVDNARAVLETIIKVKENRTTIFITHSAEVMKRCDRILCMGEGRIAEEGSYSELISRGGVFAQLMSTGEWDS